MKVDWRRAFAVGVGLSALLWGSAGWSADSSEARPLPLARDMAGAVVVGNSLFVISGETATGITPRVLRAAIQPDGSLGDWVEAGSLPLPLLYLGNNVVSAGNAIYVCGGQIAVSDPTAEVGYRTFTSNSVYWALVGPDGRLGDWRRSVSWPEANSLGVGAVTSGGFLYVLGGMDKSERIYTSTYMAPLSSDGSVGSWQSTTPLPVPLWFHNCYAVGGWVYVVGGLVGTDSSSVSLVSYRSPLQGDGSLGPWERLSRAPVTGVSGAAGCAVGDILFVFGGRGASGQPSGLVQYSHLEAGIPSVWGSESMTFPGRLYSSAAADAAHGTIYLVGGREQDLLETMTDRVVVYRVGVASVGVPSIPIRAIPSSVPPPAASSGQFMDYATALRLAGESNRFVFVFFLQPTSKGSRDAWAYVVNRPEFLSALPKNVIPAYLDVAQHPDLAETFQVYKLPAYGVVDSQGKAVAVTSQAMTGKEILDFIAKNAK